MDLKFSLDLKPTLGFQTLELRPDPEILYDLLIVGGGPAGLNAALYATRKGFQTAILTKRKGGQLLDTTVVENYLGIQDQTGEALAASFVKHVEQLAVPVAVDADVRDHQLKDGVHQLTLTDGRVFQSRAVLVATGSTPRHLDVPGEAAYAGKGVAYCAICDAPLFRDQKVIIAGGGNSAVDAALDVAKYTADVHLVHRSQFRADQILLDQLLANPRIKVSLETQILEILGDGKHLTGIRVLDKKTNQESILPAEGLFIEIGHLPNLGPFEGKVDVNALGEIATDQKNATSLPGVFAAGDVTPLPYKQIIMAAADGAKAALAISEYLTLLPPGGNTQQTQELT